MPIPFAFICFILFEYFSSPVLMAQTEFTHYTHTPNYPYIFSKPVRFSSEDTLPLILFLHGRSLSGNDLNMLKKYGVIHAQLKGREIPAYVAAPQLPKGQSWNPNHLSAMIDHLISLHPIDPARIYVVGMSLGAYGALHFAGAFPEKVAAVVSLCGGGNINDACRLATLPVWIQHGQKDASVPFTESEKIARAIQSCHPEPNCTFSILPQANHGDLYRVFYDDDLYEWLFHQRKSTLPSFQVRSPAETTP